VTPLDALHILARAAAGLLLTIASVFAALLCGMFLSDLVRMLSRERKM
jgi:hypothetical protein